LRQLDSVVAQALEDPVESRTGEHAKLSVFRAFCQQVDLPPHPAWLEQASPTHQLRIVKNYMFWLVRDRHISCDFKGARAYVAPIIRWARMRHNPLDRMPAAEYRNLKQAFNKHAVISPKLKIALPRKMVRLLVQTWCYETDAVQRTTLLKPLLGTAAMLYLTLGIRAGNILMGTGDNRWKQVLLVGDVNSDRYDRNPRKRRPLFILNSRLKNSKLPVISAVPFNTVTTNPNRFCAATRLLELVRKRKKEGALPTDPLFLHPRGQPLSTSVANSHLQKFVKNTCISRDLPERYAKLFSLKSFRKSVASQMQKWGCAPQTIALQLKHNAIDSQMSYICKYHDKHRDLERDLYKCVTPREA
jgi:hypothetical protein